MPYTVHQAKTHSSRLLKEAEAGQEVSVTRGTIPIAEIVAIAPTEPEPELPVWLTGAYRGKVSWIEGAFDPETGEELIESGLGYMLDVPLVRLQIRRQKMKCLLDTHSFLWLVNTPEVLSDRVLEIARDRAATIWSPFVIPWEIAIKAKTGKLNAMWVLDDFEAKVTKASFEIQGMTVRDWLFVER
jgi:antitoxin (DNA-binding transcriptional repressor) of toxin-antitoxin stability system